MKSIIAAVVTCIVLFGSSYAASTYYTNLENTSSTEDETENETPDEQDGSNESTLPPNTDGIKKEDMMPVAHRPEKSVSLEAVLQMSNSIKQMEEKLILREQQVAKEESRVSMLFQDLQTEHEELQAYSEGVDAKVKALEKMTDEARQLLATIEQRKAEVAALEKKTGTDGGAQQKQMDDKVAYVKGWFSNLEPEQASDYLKEFANTGRMEFAASLLHKMPDRQKTKILAALNDPVLVSQLIENLKIKKKAEN